MRVLMVLLLAGCGGGTSGDKVDDTAIAGAGEDCSNGLDDDGDGAYDCGDPDCWTGGACPEVCDNGGDDDGDGSTDCADADCDGECPEDCADGRDNDGDGAVDCSDDDCLGQCPEDCDNGVDDDGDGLVDCVDDDCADACPEDCANGEDDDFDGQLDCDDEECASTCDGDADGFIGEALGGDDCDDTNAAVNPDADEVCGNGDDDCDGLVDEEDPDIDRGSLTLFYSDRDFDTWGDSTSPYPACEAPPGMVDRGGDCDDSSNGVYPGQVERCNLQDDDCDGLIDDEDDGIDPSTQLEFFLDEDGDGLGGELVLRCWPSDGLVDEGGDCDDSNPDLVGPGEWWVDGDGDGFGAGPIDGPLCEPPSPGHVLVVLGEDCRDDEPAISPGLDEVCDNDVDDDCDGVVDGVIGHDGRCLGCGAASAIGYEPGVYWRMDQPSGLMLDAGRGTAAHGTIVGTPDLYDGIGQDAAWGLDGDDHVLKEFWDDVPRDRWTVSFWLRTTDRDAGVISYASSADTHDLAIDIDDAGALRVQVVGFEHTFAPVVADGAWHHVAVTWETLTGRTELYVDSAVRGEATLAASRRLTYAGTLMAGAAQACISCVDRPLTGVLDEVTVFPVVLNALEIGDVYLGTSCDEGARCNGVDDDADGVIDERLVGQTGCPADGCDAVYDAGAWYGPILYDLLAGDAVCE
ncbi:MAG: hypothetical protein ACI8PZ_003036 [Myxococcota bacterium]|jgi:hypothetical protein